MAKRISELGSPPGVPVDLEAGDLFEISRLGEGGDPNQSLPTSIAKIKAALMLTAADVGLGSVLNFPQREKLTANRTYYVRTDGSDSNNGLANTSGGAFLTIAKALAVVAALDLGGFTVTVQVGTGTWTVAVALPALVGGSAILLGNESTPANVVLSNATISANGIGGGWHLRGLKLERSTAGQQIFVTNNSAVQFQNIDFGALSGGFGYHILATAGGRVQASGNYTISGGASYHWGAFDGASITVQAKTVTLSGTPAFTGFALASRAGVIACNANTFSGSATGVRYNVTINGVIDTAGGGANYLPGSVAGAVASGGVYDTTTDYLAASTPVLLASTEDQTITGGARVTSKALGTITTGTVTPDPGDRALQSYTNNGAHTLAPGSNTGAYVLDITNGASAGAITTSGWTKVAGDAFTTTNGHKFRCHCSVGTAGSLMVVQALQ